MGLNEPKGVFQQLSLCPLPSCLEEGMSLLCMRAGRRQEVGGRGWITWECPQVGQDCSHCPTDDFSEWFLGHIYANTRP